MVTAFPMSFSKRMGRSLHQHKIHTEPVDVKNNRSVLSPSLNTNCRKKRVDTFSIHADECCRAGGSNTFRLASASDTCVRLYESSCRIWDMNAVVNVFGFLLDSPRMYDSHERRVSMRLRAGQGAPNASTSDLSTSKQAKWVTTLSSFFFLHSSHAS